jgi:hypothetical protein
MRSAPRLTWHKQRERRLCSLSLKPNTSDRCALLSAHGTVAPSIIQDRVIYATCMTDGRTAGDIDPKGAAALEVLALWDFVRATLDSLKGGKEGRRRVA